MNKTILLIIILFSFNIFLYSNPNNESKVLEAGIIGGYSIINNSAEIPLIPGSSDCGIFNDGTSNGMWAGIDLNYELINGFLFPGIRIIYEKRKAELRKLTSTYEVFDPISKSYLPFVREHSFDGDLEYLLIDLGSRIKPLEFLPVFFRIGFEIGNPIFGTNYLNKEKIVTPQSALFPDNSKQRNVSAGEINTAGTSIGLTGAIQGEIALDNGLNIIPEVSYRYGLNSVVNDLKWDVNIMRFGVGVTYKMDLSPKPIPKEEKPIILPTPPMPMPPTLADYPSIIRSFEAVPVNYTETIVTQTYPLLPYIFFDSAKAELKSTYITDKSINHFNENVLPKETLGIYYHLLDIIGSRLQKNKNVKLTLTGVTDGEELQTLDERLSLAKDRANNIAEYISKKWGIDPSRFIIKSRNLPALPTNRAYLEGYEENRRVELYCEDPEILKPVIHSKFFEYSSNQNQISFNIAFTDKDVVEWEINIPQANINISSRATGKSENIREIVIDITPSLKELLTKSITNGEKIFAELKVKTSLNTIETRKAILNISKSQNQYEVGRLNLIVFDFDRSDISDMNKIMIGDFIESSIKESSTTKITGSTDRLGEPDYNQRLSSNRATSVNNYIMGVKQNIKVNEISGTGSTILLYNNDIPEGRFYCRTVLIEVKTPIE